MSTTCTPNNRSPRQTATCAVSTSFTIALGYTIFIIRNFGINFDIYKKHGSHFQCFCTTALERLSHPQSQALHCLLAEHSTASLSDVVFVPSFSIIQSDNAPKWRTCRGHHRPEVWVSQTCGSFHFGGHFVNTFLVMFGCLGLDVGFKCVLYWPLKADRPEFNQNAVCFLQRV